MGGMRAYSIGKGWWRMRVEGGRGDTLDPQGRGDGGAMVDGIEVQPLRLDWVKGEG